MAWFEVGRKLSNLLESGGSHIQQCRVGGLIEAAVTAVVTTAFQSVCENETSSSRKSRVWLLVTYFPCEDGPAPILH